MPGTLLITDDVGTKEKQMIPLHVAHKYVRKQMIKLCECEES